MKSSNQLTEQQVRVIDELYASDYVFISLMVVRSSYLSAFGLELATLPLIQLGDGRTVVRSDVVAKLIAERLTSDVFGLDVSDEAICAGKSGSRARIREATRRILGAVRK
jgi:hypothetical protein